MLNNLSIRLEVKPADLWVGCYWKRQAHALHLWICLIPCLPLYLIITGEEGTK
jgi:hypothetical protein